MAIVIPFPRRGSIARTPSELKLKVYVDRVGYYADCTPAERAIVIAESLEKSRSGDSLDAVIEQASTLARALVTQRTELAQVLPL
jgi:hypothetical protein